MTTPTRASKAFLLGYASGKNDSADLIEAPATEIQTRFDLARAVRALKPKPHVPARTAPKESR